MRAALVIAGVCASGAALAAPAVSFQVDVRDGAPHLVATVDGAGRAPLDAFTVTSDGARPAVARATSIRDYAKSDEPVEIAFVINGQEIWMGNDEIEVDENARYVGVLKGLEAAIDRLDLGMLVPAGSTATVITYDTGARVLVPPTSVGKLTGGMLGWQHDYFGKIGTDMVQGIELAMSELEHSTAPRRALIILGDGNDTNNDFAKTALVELKKRAARQRIATYAIIYKSVVSADGNAITAMVPHAKLVNSIDGIGATLQAITHDLADRSYVTFDAAALPFDGRAHDLTVSAGNELIDTQTIVLPALPDGTPWWRRAWLAQLVAGFVLVGAWIGFTRWRVTAAR